MKNMFNKPLVSIITPSYNQGRFIEETILSVKYQDYPYIEHVIVDGGSTDNTLEILQRCNNSIKWISEPDKGFADAVNKGIHMSSGQIIAIQNSDDTYHSCDAISKAVESFKRKSLVGVVFGDSATIDQDGRIINSGERAHQGYNFPALLCSEIIIPQASAFISRSALEAVGGKLDTNIDWCADFDLWVRIGLQFPIIYIPEVLANYRIHPEHRQRNSSYASLNPRDRRRALDKMFSISGLPPEIQALRNRAYAGTYLNESSRLCSFGRTKETGKRIATAIRLYPPYLLSRRLFNVNRSLFIAFLKPLLGEGVIDYLRRVKHSIQREDMQEEKVQSRWWE